MTALSIAIEGGFSGTGRFDLARYIGSLDDPDVRQAAEQRSGIKHGRLVGPAACFAALASAAVLTRMCAGTTGLICTGGPWALPASTRFFERMTTAGAGFVNPLQFPSTLVSGTATAVARMLHTHAFALTVGHDRFAFFDALYSARASLRSQMAGQVIVAATCAADPAVERARECAGLLTPTLDVAAAFGVSTSGASDLELLDLSLDSDSVREGDGGYVYRANWRGESLSCTIETPLSQGEAFGAAGAVLCLSAAKYHSVFASEPNAPFTICMTSDERCSSATFIVRTT